MNKTILALATAVVFGTLSSAAMADTALEQGDSGSYGRPHVAATAPVQAARQASVALQGEAAAYPDARQGAQVARSQQLERAHALAAAPAIGSAPYQAN